MSKFSFAERYRLDICWQSVEAVDDRSVKLNGCYLTGPVLRDVAKLNVKDEIRLDFSNQYIIYTKDFYVAVLSWDGFDRKEDKIYLHNVVLKGKYLYNVPKINHSDYIVVNTADHEDEKHYRNLNYTAYLLKKDGSIYDFNRVEGNNA